jgi:hypothetical protein
MWMGTAGKTGIFAADFSRKKLFRINGLHLGCSSGEQLTAASVKSLSGLRWKNRWLETSRAYFWLLPSAGRPGSTL